jgi:cell division protein FtsI (penicillin-binding protein 3)
LRAPREAEAEHHRLVRLRSALLIMILILAFGGLAARLTSLHVVQARSLDRIAQRQQIGTMVIDPRRGRLLDRRGRPLAVNVDATSIYADPSKVENHAAFARKIAPALGVRPVDVLERLRGGQRFVWLARKVAPAVADAVRAQRHGDAVGFLVEARRQYPNGSLAAHVIGFAGIDNQGLSGAELEFDRHLAGRAGLAHVERDAMGRPRIETRRIIRDPTDGADVVLTIDEILQHIAERELGAAMASTRSTWGAILAMDPANGEVLAMATAPRFDPNAYAKARPSQWNNPAVARAYEPGSTFKIFLAAAALDSGVVGEREVFANNGALRVAGGYVIREAHGRTYSRPTLRDIVKVSSNVGAAMVATRIGGRRLHDTVRKLGFGAPTGIDLPGEAEGLVPALEQWRAPMLQTIGFGQGISATPMQILVAGAALANGGTVVRPRMLRAVRDPEGRGLEVTAAVPERQAVSSAAARRVIDMMIEGVEDGTGTQARIDGYTVAGKTGTAQKPSANGGYMPDAYVASFLGIVPVGRPRLVVLVILDSPRGQYYGGAVAAPVFRAFATQALWHLRVTPTEPLSDASTGTGSGRGASDATTGRR